MIDSAQHPNDPRILFLPLAVDGPLGRCPVDEGVLARRLPDFLHLLLNGGSTQGPTGMLEVQSAPHDGTPRWVTLSEPPHPADVLAMLGGKAGIEALVSGSVQRLDGHLALNVSVHFTAGLAGSEVELDLGDDGGPFGSGDFEGRGADDGGFDPADFDLSDFDPAEFGASDFGGSDFGGSGFGGADFDALDFDPTDSDALDFDPSDFDGPGLDASGPGEQSSGGFAADSGPFEESSFGESPFDLGGSFGESAEGLPRVIHGVVHLQEPVPGLLRLAEHLAAVLHLAPLRPDLRLLTTHSTAFYRYLQGLDGAALLGGDPELERHRRGAALMAPFADALRLDPGFGLALRTIANSLLAALQDERVDEADCLVTLDNCLDSRPGDSEGCVAIAEQLAMIGEEDRAARWLGHAIGMEPPAPRALESLGVLLANRGDTEQARELWHRGAAVDGAPDFHAHLARLAFGDGESAAAWRAVERGLRATWERMARSAEWLGGERGSSALLRCLADHLDRDDWPFAVEAGVLALRGLLVDDQARVDLGICLARLGHPDAAMVELRGGLDGDIGPEAVDRGTRTLLTLEIPGFERRFAQVSERAVQGRDPAAALRDLQGFLEHRGDFWPAMFYAGMAMKRLGQGDAALDVMAEVLQRRPGQVDALQESAELFSARGNAKRALECIEEALMSHPELADLHLRRARYLEQLGRNSEAARALDHAVDLDRRHDQEQVRSDRRLRRERRGDDRLPRDPFGLD